MNNPEEKQAVQSELADKPALSRRLWRHIRKVYYDEISPEIVFDDQTKFTVYAQKIDDLLKEIHIHGSMTDSEYAAIHASLHLRSSFYHAYINYYHNLDIPRAATQSLESLDYAKAFRKQFNADEYPATDMFIDVSEAMNSLFIGVKEFMGSNYSLSINYLMSARSRLRDKDEIGYGIALHSLHQQALQLEAMALVNDGIHMARAKSLHAESMRILDTIVKSAQHGDESESVYHYFSALASFYRAQFKIELDIHELMLSNYGRFLGSRKRMLRHVIAAKSELNHVRGGGVVSQNMLDLIEPQLQFFEDFYTFSTGFAQLMKMQLTGSYRSPRKVKQLQEQLSQAQNRIERIGEFGIRYVSKIQHLQQQLNNIERLMRPGKKDFGAYSGLITAVVFLSSICVISLLNFTTQANITISYTFMLLLLIVALVAGFGLGALKFRYVLQDLFKLAWAKKP